MGFPFGSPAGVPAGVPAQGFPPEFLPRFPLEVPQAFRSSFPGRRRHGDSITTGCNPHLFVRCFSIFCGLGSWRVVSFLSRNPIPPSARSLALATHGYWNVQFQQCTLGTLQELSRRTKPYPGLKLKTSGRRFHWWKRRNLLVLIAEDLDAVGTVAHW